MPKKIHIQVSQEDIEEALADGDQNNACWCPVARAIRRLQPEAGIDVWGHLASIDGMDYKLPSKAQTFIAKFDAFEKVKPFEFDMEELGPTP